LISDRRRGLSDADDDILSRLLLAQTTPQGLSDLELVHNCIFILNAGHETTTNLLANGIYSLIQAPPAWRALAASPDLLPAAVEEFLRYESPNQLGNRKALIDTTVGGERINAGDYLWLGIGAANRDPREFENPDSLDISRQHNPHLAFAAGIHTCIGLNVARLEGRIAIGRLRDRVGRIEMAGDAVRSHRARFRGFDACPVRIN
jgi:cytochrome P450